MSEEITQYLATDAQELPFNGDEPSYCASSTALETDVVAALKMVRDPEIPVNLVDLGLIYDLKIDDAGIVHIDMTLTTPACPVAGSLPAQVQNIVSLVPGVTAVLVNLIWSPPWTKARMTTEAALELGLL